MPAPPPRPRPVAPPPGEAMVYIGPRPTMSYVFEVVAQLHSGAAAVVVKARGLAIAKAVDVVEVVRNKLLVDAVEVGPIHIETERLVNRAGRETRVSAIAIPLHRRPGAAPPPPATPSAPAAPG
jgi:archaea-specific DNA-binding protein